MAKSLDEAYAQYLEKAKWKSGKKLTRRQYAIAHKDSYDAVDDDEDDDVAIATSPARSRTRSYTRR
jgi:hypothetical protein